MGEKYEELLKILPYKDLIKADNWRGFHDDAAPLLSKCTNWKLRRSPNINFHFGDSICYARNHHYAMRFTVNF